MRIRLISVFLLLVVFVGCINVPSGPVCNKPYILVGEDCCLDTDDNSICDSDETSTTTTTSTTSTTTTTSTTSSTTTTRATTTTNTTTTTTTSTTTTTTSTTSTTTQKILPVSEKAFRTHIINSTEYQNFILDYGQLNMMVFVDTDSYAHVKTIIENLDEENNMDCLDCFNFSRDTIWVSEFGNKDYGMGMCILDMETGTGAMYRSTGKNKLACRCDTI
jgi:hypothetical protein